MFKYNTRSVILGILFSLCVAYFVVALLNAGAHDRQKEIFKTRLAAAVSKRDQSAEHVAVRLRDLTDFQWDKVYIFRPYTTPEDINKALGFIWAEAEETQIDKFDNFNLIVFTANNKVVSYVNLPLSIGNFTAGGAEERLQRGVGADQAIFSIEAQNHIVLQE